MRRKNECGRNFLLLIYFPPHISYLGCYSTLEGDLESKHADGHTRLSREYNVFILHANTHQTTTIMGNILKTKTT